MRYGLNVSNIGSYADPSTAVELARTAETARWDGIFIWDHLGFVWNGPAADPWVTLTAIAASTTRLRLGTAVAPLPRYRPHMLAHTLTTLDVLSRGRVVLGVGLGGVPREFSAFGDPDDPKVRAAMVDEGLEVLTTLWTGESVRHHKRFYTVNDITLAPVPVQRPRIPIWVGGNSRAALRRAARWDGWLADSVSEREMNITPEDLTESVATIRQYRAGDAPFDVVVTGYSGPSDHQLVHQYEQAGASWWLEGIHDHRGSQEDMMQRVAAGPPSSRE